MVENSIDKIVELIAVDVKSLPMIFAEGKAGLIVDKIEKDVRSFVLEVESAKGRKDVASLSYKVAKAKKTIDDAGKQISAEHKAKAKAVDQERSQLWSRLESLQAEIRAPLTQFEETEKKRIETHNENLYFFTRIINKTQEFGPETVCSSLENFILRLEKELIFINELLTSRNWEEFNERANQLHEKAILVIKSNIAEYKLKIAEEKQIAAEKSVREAEEKLRLLELLEKSRAEEEIRKEQEKKIIGDKEIEEERLRFAKIERERELLKIQPAALSSEPEIDHEAHSKNLMRNYEHQKILKEFEGQSVVLDSINLDSAIDTIEEIFDKKIDEFQKEVALERVDAEIEEEESLPFVEKLIIFIRKNLRCTAGLICDSEIHPDKELMKYLSGKAESYKEIIIYIEKNYQGNANA